MKKKTKKKENKFAIIGMSNDGFRHRIEIKKEESSGRSFVDFMVDLGLDPIELDYILMEREGNKKIKVFNKKDWTSHHKNKDFDTDIIFGDKKVFLIIRTKKRMKLMNTLDKYSKWIKPKKFPKLKSKKNKK
jgi:hypothetical protein